MGTKPLNQWMAYFGYSWVPGKEEMFKSHMSYGEAADTIGDMLRKGAVKKNG